jgi:hypothetical protein
MSNHAIHIPELIPVLKGEKYSKACGAEARHQARAEYDGVAIDGVLFTAIAYAGVLAKLGEKMKQKPKKAKR